VQVGGTHTNSERLFLQLRAAEPDVNREFGFYSAPNLRICMWFITWSHPRSELNRRVLKPFTGYGSSDSEMSLWSPTTFRKWCKGWTMY